MERELAEIVRRLQPRWPEVDVGAVVAAAYGHLAEGARLTMYLPVLTEHLARSWLSEQRQREHASAGSDGPL